jgi:hypothetical protein
MTVLSDDPNDHNGIIVMLTLSDLLALLYFSELMEGERTSIANFNNKCCLRRLL